jgi:HTH-type transcriptional regulator/antitoxin HigA
MDPKVIHTEKEYERALGIVDTLMDAKPGTAKADLFELWTTLISVFEDQHYPIGLPNPIEAIKFRMAQAGLRQADLIPYMGSPSKVSEVLSRKRPLSLSMIRRLHQGLGIPAEVLLQEPGAALSKESDIEWNQFPLNELIKRGWISFHGTIQQAQKQAQELILTFIDPFDRDLLEPAFLRQHVRRGKAMDSYALFAWQIRVMHLANAQEVEAYQNGLVCQDFIRTVIKLSIFDDGPRLAKEYLAKHGIHLIIEKHLPKTYLDGAVMRMPDGHPIVAMTLRYNRLDNFWFTLAHELAHISLHLETDENQSFFDDLQATDTSSIEKEADHLASESMIPTNLWRAAELTTDPTAKKVKAFAQQLNIGPCIPAGRVRHETGNYRILSPLVGTNQVELEFPGSE